MDLMWKIPVIAIVGYLLGQFQTGIIVSRAIGKFDVRHRGSHSAGTTNVLRTMGWAPSVITLLGDVLKSLLASLFGLWLAGGWAGWGGWGARLGGLCAILGHNWPAFLHFHGGKGIASSLGMILVIDPWIGLALVACQFIVLALTHTMSIASLCSATLYAVLSLIVHWGRWSEVLYALFVAGLAIFSHRENIKRLIASNENKLNFKEISKISSHFHHGKEKEE